MLTAFLLNASLSLGQAPMPPVSVISPRPDAAAIAARPAALQTSSQPPLASTTPATPAQAPEIVTTPSVPATSGTTDGAASNGEPPFLVPKAEQPADAPESKVAEKYWLMKKLEGSYLGSIMEDNRVSLSGWIEQSFTGSTARYSNQPVVWNDIANQYMLNSFWVRLDKAVDTSAKEFTWGYRLDVTTGTDYRFAQMRGLFDSQLANSEIGANGQPKQNYYGIDPIQFYVNGYLPNLFEGTDIRVGRLYCPWGFESLEGVTTPLVSRSYAFNWSPPFTHMGIMVSPTFTKNWSAKLMIANGNDVFFNQAQELRSVGAIAWTSDSKNDTITYGWTYGRGKMNTSYPYYPATLGEQWEPAGRNNINVSDLVYTHNFTSAFSYSMEAIFGYQTGVPYGVPGGLFPANGPGLGANTAHWGSIANYLTYVMSPKLTSITRVEFFDDFQAQRTGYPGLYSAFTTGLQYRPTSSLLIRPELRYDYNGYSEPFEGRHYLFTAAIDAIVRY